MSAVESRRLRALANEVVGGLNDAEEAIVAALGLLAVHREAAALGIGSTRQATADLARATRRLASARHDILTANRRLDEAGVFALAPVEVVS